ncbi:MAG: AAA family ATPase [candidate division Zixibacteria bacterium]
MSEINNKWRIPVEKLRFRFDEKKVEHTPLDEIEPCCGIIGQDRAISAVELGLEIKSKGYNIFVTGLPGTGRTTAVKLLLDEIEKDETVELKDICYVNNFKMPDSPRVLYFAAGEGRKFKKAVSYLIDSLVTIIPKIFSGENYRQRRERIITEFETRQKELFKDFEKDLKEKGFVLVQLQFGQTVRPDLHPFINNEPVSLNELEKLTDEGKFPEINLKELKAEYEKLSKQFEVISGQSKKISSDLEEELNKLDTSLVVPLVNDKIETLKNLYDDEKTREYLSDLNEILIEELDLFRGTDAENAEQDGATKIRSLFNAFTVNLLVDNNGFNKRPIIIEEFPTYKNLFGSIERVYSSGSGWRSDFTRIRSGSILEANGGYLVLNAIDLFNDPQLWPMLKRTLRSGHLVISNIDTPFMSGSGLKPEKIDLDVKVILIGESRVYDTLFRADADFKKVFKVKAEFDNVMKNDESGINQYAQFVKKIVYEDDLMDVNHSGLAALLEFGVKLSGRHDRLSTRFTNIADVIRESSWLARKNGKSKIDREIIKETILMQKNRVNLIETKMHEMYQRALYLIDVTGWEIGQINGLSVYDLGEHSFGRPTRITASLSPGADGIINIEREASLSGRLYDKGVLILTGFMRHRFGSKRPLVFTASLCFEQSYSGVDGDSASSTEIYALLSALSGKPINQSLAVTGSVNQKGEIQPIGGVNQKIEGYFDTCMINGLTGEQGVMIPKQNEPELMLKDEIIEAVEKNKFHIYAVENIDEGIELLTGIPAGEINDDGDYPEDTINYLADIKLRELADTWRDYIK